MKQQKSTYTAVGTETSVRADEKSPLRSSTVGEMWVYGLDWAGPG